MKEFLLTASIVIFAAAAAVLAESKAGKPCSVRPEKGTPGSELAGMARVTEENARKAALASLGEGVKAEVKESELEVEKGCLIFSFDIRVAGRSGIQEIQVDAGDGKVLSSEHETDKKEAAEKPKEKPAPKKN